MAIQPEALATFPRYNVLDAILFEIERYNPSDFPTLEEAKIFFCLVAKESQSAFTKSTDTEIEMRVMGEERELLCDFIKLQNEDSLSSVEPLFYRRVLTEEESKSVRENLEARWSIGKDYWYPLTTWKRDDVEAFQDVYFEQEFGFEKLRQILSSHDVKKNWEIREDGKDYEIELSAFEPYYNGAEGFWCNESFDWIIYASHESSITIGGWLLQEVKDNWSNWEKRVWTTPLFE